MMDRVTSSMPGVQEMFTSVTAMKHTGKSEEIADARRLDALRRIKLRHWRGDSGGWWNVGVVI